MRTCPNGSMFAAGTSTRLAYMRCVFFFKERCLKCFVFISFSPLPFDGVVFCFHLFCLLLSWPLPILVALYSVFSLPYSSLLLSLFSSFFSLSFSLPLCLLKSKSRLSQLDFSADLSLLNLARPLPQQVINGSTAPCPSAVQTSTQSQYPLGNIRKLDTAVLLVGQTLRKQKHPMDWRGTFDLASRGSQRKGRISWVAVGRPKKKCEIEQQIQEIQNKEKIDERYSETELLRKSTSISSHLKWRLAISGHICTKWRSTSKMSTFCQVLGSTPSTCGSAQDQVPTLPFGPVTQDVGVIFGAASLQ